MRLPIILRCINYYSNWDLCEPHRAFKCTGRVPTVVRGRCRSLEMAIRQLQTHLLSLLHASLLDFLPLLLLFVSLHLFTKELTVLHWTKVTMILYWGFVVLAALASLASTRPTGGAQVWGQLRENVSGLHIYNSYLPRWVRTRWLISELPDQACHLSHSWEPLVWQHRRLLGLPSRYR